MTKAVFVSLAVVMAPLLMVIRTKSASVVTLRVPNALTLVMLEIDGDAYSARLNFRSELTARTLA
jgi:hypothetical protein